MSQQAARTRRDRAAERRAWERQKTSARRQLWEEVERNAPQCPWCNRAQMRRAYGPYPHTDEVHRGATFECHECGSELTVPEQHFAKRMNDLLGRVIRSEEGPHVT